MVYTGAPALTDEEIKSLLNEAIRARFCSLNKDGTIHAVPVAFLYKNNQIVFITTEASHKVKNIKLNKRVTVLIDVNKSYRGVIIYGQAELDFDDVFSMNILLLEKVMSQDLAECFTKELFNIIENLVMVRVTPERIVSFDYGKDEIHKQILRSVLFNHLTYSN
jgi:nitroimidazol reductase NimA-like FMN-containing flavoprotein (pyridoxamine 5'-phosphate oxidase superfamily)